MRSEDGYKYIMEGIKRLEEVHDIHMRVYGEKNMENLTKYLSTAPVLATLWMTFTAGFIIEANRFFPDALYFPM